MHRILDKGGNLYQILTPGAFLMGPFLEDYLRVPEPDVFLCKISFKILVDTHTDPLWPGYDPEDSRLAVPYVHRVSKHVEDGEIVFDNHDRSFRCQFPDQFGCRNALVDIQKWRDLIKEIEIGVPGETGSNCYPLEFPPLTVPIAWSRSASSLSTGMSSASLPRSSVVVRKLADRPGKNFRYIIDILRLDRDLFALL